MSRNRSNGRPRRAMALRSSLAVGLAVAATASGLTALPASAIGQKVMLRSLIISSGDPATLAMAAELDREGIPYTTVTVAAAGRPAIDAAFLEDAGTGTARFQAVFLPNQAGGGLAAAELAALAGYETAYGIRQVDGYEYPGASTGLAAPTYSGPLDGAGVTVGPAGLSGPFAYLKGTLTVDDFDPLTTETYGYLASPAAALPAGQSFTPLLTASLGSTSGVLAGVYGHDGREELVFPAAFNQYMQWFNETAPGIVSWATRGVHLGYQRNYFDVHVDDVFLADSRWSVAGNCTPGDGCVDPNVTSTDIRMTPADVTKLVAWQKAHGFKLDMVFNAYGSDLAKAAGAGSDPLTTAFVDNQAEFPWINHTYSHPYLGCIQIAPTVQGQTWHCATTAIEQPRQDLEIVQAESGGVQWAAQSVITDQVALNLAWAQVNRLTDFDPAELVTGEHSGLASLPWQPQDNPFLAPALAGLGIHYTGSDASRETDPRTLVGGVTSTVPRHPANIFYNAGTYQDEIDEYNWLYTSVADGGGGICENNATSTCITPLPSATAAEAKASFDNYLTPLEVRNALKYVLTNDPRPFYAHQSNLAEDGILYPVVQGVLDSYQAVYDTSKAPLQQLDLTGQYQALTRLSAWKAVSASVDGYLDSTGVHLPATSVAVPVTVPVGSTGGTSGPALQSYAGALSGWVGGGSTVVLPTSAGGYLVKAPATVAGSPIIGTAVPGSTTATVAWTAPASDGGSPITGYVLRGYVGTATTPTLTANAAAGVASTVFGGLINGTSYRFDVSAVNAIGTGTASAVSNPVIPRLALAPVPSNVTAVAGNASATVTWSPPANSVGVTGYRVRAYLGTTTSVSKTVNVAASGLSASVTGLTNGTAYTFDVAAVYVSAGPASVRSAAVTPSLISQGSGAPTITSVVPGTSSAVVGWLPPTDTGAGTPSGYRIRAYLGSGTAVARTVTVTGTATTAPATTATVAGLTNGVGYTFDVTVQYSTGNGPTSARSAGVVPVATVAGTPVIGIAAAGTAGGAITATARWSVPASNGGSAITGYQVTASALATNGSVTRTITSPVVSGRSYSMTLPAIGLYSFTVVAVNAVGSSQPSASSNSVTAR